MTSTVFSFTSTAYSIITANDSRVWVKNYQDLEYSLTLPLNSKSVMIKIPKKKLFYRIRNFQRSQSIEPIFLKFPTDTNYASKLAQSLAKEDHYYNLYKILKLSIDDAKSNQNNMVKLPVSPSILKMLNKEKLRQKFQNTHKMILVNAKTLRHNKTKLDMLTSQLKPFINESERLKLLSKINKQHHIEVDKDLLPKFAKKTVKTYTVFRGPNCFHAALSFHSKFLGQSAFFNVIREKGYHSSMINYDELWRALNSNFYEINTAIEPIKYGDILVFFDLPAIHHTHISFRWIKHTAAYLFNGFTFSKGSKSANSPYTIKSLKSEWDTWSKIAKKLRVKVFRRGLKNVTKRPPQDLTDWIY